ncbi:lipoprotein [Mycoplasma mycoides subsp. capri]|uniref:lipoprotein n=1 Tax=Mycoplasma mycoides TaxID=2102 RepID=UPI00223F2A6B|nr:lipoprotein [Mycoplasma mycoides]UZK64426.1 lipoprotein [Mycoplasma mycoides subsp. capri]
MKKVLTTLSVLSMITIPITITVSCSSWRTAPMTVKQISDVLDIYKNESLKQTNSDNVVVIKASGLSNIDINSLQKIKENRENKLNKKIEENSKLIIDKLTEKISSVVSNKIINFETIDSDKTNLKDDIFSNQITKDFIKEKWKPYYLTISLADINFNSLASQNKDQWLSKLNGLQTVTFRNKDKSISIDKTNKPKWFDTSVNKVSIIDSLKLDSMLSSKTDTNLKINKIVYLVSFNANVLSFKDAKNVAFYIEHDLNN